MAWRMIMALFSLSQDIVHISVYCLPCQPGIMCVCMPAFSSRIELKPVHSVWRICLLSLVWMSRIRWRVANKKTEMNVDPLLLFACSLKCVSLYSPGWPRIHCIPKVDLKFMTILLLQAPNVRPTGLSQNIGFSFIFFLKLENLLSIQLQVTKKFSRQEW